MKDSKKAVIYARYSSHTQSEMSIEGQLKECHSFARREGYLVISEYIDRAKSGTEAEKRPQFQKMINDSNRRQFDFVICYQLDRFARNRYDSATYKARLKKNGVRVVSARENLSEDASGILMESVLEGMAEYYSAELSQKIRRGISLAVENHQFIGGVVPLGYKLTADKKYEIDHATAPIVRRIFKLYASGHSLKETGAKVIDEYGIEIGNVYNYIGKILENRNYIGTYTRGGYSAENAMPRIVDDALFDKVQIMRNKKKKTPATARAYVEYLLTTKIFCGYCREMMVGTGGTSKSGKVHHYYGCKNYINKKGCKKKNVKKDYIEHFVISKAREQLTENNIALIAKVVHEASKRDGNAHAINDIKRKLKENAKAIENLLIAIETGEHMDLLSQRITDKQTEKANLEKSLAIEMMNQDEIPELDIKFFLHQLKSAKVDDADCNRALIAIFVNAIYLYDDKATLIFNASDKPAGVDFALVDEIEKLNKGEKIEGGRCSYMMQRTPLP